MSRRIVRITGITGGKADAKMYPRAAQFTASAGFDPDQGLTSADDDPSGVAVPTAYSKFSSSSVDAPVIAWITTPKVANRVYAVTNTGKIFRYTGSGGSETSIGQVAGSNAGGACYYNNYIYVFGTGASKNDVSRYGPLDGTPALTDAWWSGLGLTALTNTTYPQINLVKIPNHWGFVHTDNSLYFADFADGQGIVNRIHTTKDTYEGEIDDPNVPSAYDVVDLPLGFYPTAFASYGTSVAIASLQSVDDAFGVNQGNAAVFLWDPTNENTFDQQIYLPDPICTALLSHNGKLDAFSGNILGGCRVSRYVGGTTFQELSFVDDSVPPFAGAVDAYGDRIMFGGYVRNPLHSACVWALNSRTRTRENDLQNVAVFGNQTANNGQNCTAVRVVSQMSALRSQPELFVAQSSDTTKELYQRVTSGNGTIGSCWLTPVVTVGQKFRIERVRIPFGTAFSSGTSIEMQVVSDNGTATSSALTLSNFVQPGAYRVTFKQEEINVIAQNDFLLKFNYSGVNATVATPISFPIEVWLDVFEDEPNYE